MAAKSGGRELLMAMRRMALCILYVEFIEICWSGVVYAGSMTFYMPFISAMSVSAWFQRGKFSICLEGGISSVDPDVTWFFGWHFGMSECGDLYAW